MSEQCPICGADMMHVNSNLRKNFHDQKKARESRERQLAEIKQRDDAIRQDERDKVHERMRLKFTLAVKEIDAFFTELKDGEPLWWEVLCEH